MARASDRPRFRSPPPAAADNARSGVNAMNALYSASWRSMRASNAVAYSTGDNFFPPINSAASARPR